MFWFFPSAFYSYKKIPQTPHGDKKTAVALELLFSQVQVN
jgi:hypothetical protein